ncbi:MAG: hypothetical protein ACKO14_10940 [Armatimonadota bacterium]
MVLPMFVSVESVEQRPGTVTVPNVGFFVPSDASVRQAFGSTWTSVGLRNRPDWTRRDVIYSPDIRIVNASGRRDDGTWLTLLPAFWRASLQLGQTEKPVKLAIFAEAGILGAFTTGATSRFAAAPATGVGVSVSRDRLDIEAQYLQPSGIDGRDFTGFAISFGYRL